MLALGWLGAIACCLGYGAGSVVQSAGARRVALITGPAGLIRVLRQGPYLLGLGLDAVAFLGSLVAAQQLPLFLVQTIMTASVAVTAILAALGGARLSGRQWAAIAALMAGIGLLSAAARTGRATHPSSGFGWIVLASCLLPTVLGVAGSRLRGRASWVILALAAGLGFGIVAVAARGLSAIPIDWTLLGQPLVWALVVAGVTAMTSFAASLQRGPVTSVTAISFAVELIGPAFVGIAVLGDSVAAGWGTAAVIGFLMVVSGVAGLVWRTDPSFLSAGGENAGT